MTARQFYIVLWIVTVSTKVQKLPSLVSSRLGKDSYLLPLGFLIINIFLIMLAFFILHKTKHKIINSKSSSVISKIFKKLFLAFIVVYFLSQSLLLYETVQNLFAHVLFYNLPWTLFSLMLTATVFFLAYTGITNIARNFELYFLLIVSSYLIISIFGGVQGGFSVVLPFETVRVKSVIQAMFDFNLWFGDFFLILFLGKSSNGIKLKWTLVCYTLAMVFVSVLYIEFLGIYKAYAPLKPSLISVLSEQSMLGINIGRLDWFLILATEIGTILSCAVFLYYAKLCSEFIFPKAKKSVVLLVLSSVLYLTDILYLVDTHKKEFLFLNYISYLSLGVKILSLLVLLLYVAGLSLKAKQKPKLLKTYGEKLWRK